MKTKNFLLNTTGIFLIFALFAAFVVPAQEMSFIQPAKSSKKIPTMIKADSISIDIANNILIFTGNVKSDDGNTVITCKKMTIILEDKKSGDPSSEENKQISRISCQGNVVIVMKTQDKVDKTETKDVK